MRILLRARYPVVTTERLKRAQTEGGDGVMEESPVRPGKFTRIADVIFQCMERDREAQEKKWAEEK